MSSLINFLAKHELSFGSVGFEHMYLKDLYVKGLSGGAVRTKRVKALVNLLMCP